MGSIDENNRDFKKVDVQVDNFEFALITFKYKDKQVRRILLNIQKMDITPSGEKLFSNVQFELSDVDDPNFHVQFGDSKAVDLWKIK